MLKQENFPDHQKYNTFIGKSTNTSTSLQRATHILSCLSNDFNTVTDIASYCKYSISTVHRLLQALRELNWTIQDDNSHKYYLGPLLTQLASNRIAAHKYLIMHSLLEMIRLSDITQETISLAIMVQLHHMLLHEISSKQELKINEEGKRTGQVYVGATAKVLLSQLNNEDLRTTLKHVKYDRVIGSAAINKTVLMAQLKEISQQGYCITFGERISGAVCISVPIKNYTCPASLNILGPENRINTKINEFVQELKSSAGRISDEISVVFTEKEVI